MVSVASVKVAMLLQRTSRFDNRVLREARALAAAGLADAWTRYLPPLGEPDPPDAVTPVTAVTPQVRPVTAPAPVTATSVTPPVEPPQHEPSGPGRVTDAPVTPPPPVTPLTRHVTAVTDVTATDGREG